MAEPIDTGDYVQKKRNKPTNKIYIIDFLLGAGKPNASVQFSAPNQESAAAVAGIIVSTNWPNLVGFNLYLYNPEYDHDREFLMHVPAMQMSVQLTPEINKAVGAQVMKAVIPVVPPKDGGENLSKLAKEAKERGSQLL